MWPFSDENMEVLRTVPVSCWLFVTIICLSTHLGGVYGVHDFNVYRMQHFDLHGSQFGSRSALLNMEARGMAAKMLNRKCVFVLWAELTPDVFQDLISRGAGSLLVLLPQDWSNESNETITSWISVESYLLSIEVSIPVYFTYEAPDLLEVYHTLALTAQSDGSGTASSAIVSSVIGEGYFVIADTPEATVLSEPNNEIVTMTGKLIGAGYDEDLPSVAIVTHYDSFGLAPSLSMSGDSGGSGVAAIMELARLFSKLYSNPQHKPKYNILFVITGGGNLNYFGTKYFIEDMIEDADSHLLSDADYTLCLDALAGGSEMFLHVSKPPKVDTKAYELIQHLNKSSQLLHNSSVTLNHKKIRIGDDLLAWEHERFSLRRLPAVTLSHFNNHVDPRRKSMFHNKVDSKILYKNVQVLAEAISRHILGLNNMDNYSTPLLTGGLVKEKYLTAWLQKLSSIPRSPQLFNKDHSLLTSLEQTLSQYVNEVSSFSHKPDKADPEFVLYSSHSTTVHTYSVKPAIFDLFLAFGIVAYVGSIYFIILYFNIIQDAVSQLLPKRRMKTD